MMASRDLVLRNRDNWYNNGKTGVMSKIIDLNQVFVSVVVTHAYQDFDSFAKVGEQNYVYSSLLYFFLGSPFELYS